MKLKLYMDVFPGWDPQHANATANPLYEKCSGFKRLSFMSRDT